MNQIVPGVLLRSRMAPEVEQGCIPTPDSCLVDGERIDQLQEEYSEMRAAFEARLKVLSEREKRSAAGAPELTARLISALYMGS